MAFNHGNQVVGSFQLRRQRLLAWEQNVVAQLTIDQFCHQSVQCPPAGCNKLKNLFALVLVPGKGSLNGLDLAFDASDPAQRSSRPNQSFASRSEKLSAKDSSGELDGQPTITKNTSSTKSVMARSLYSVARPASGQNWFAAHKRKAIASRTALNISAAPGRRTD